MAAAAAGALRLNEWPISRNMLGVENVVEMVTCCGEFSPGFDRAMKDTIAMFKVPQDGFFDKLLPFLSDNESDSRFR